MRIFGSDRISGLMQRLGMEEGVPIEHKMVTKAIERAQKQVEAQNFSVRKHLLEYDDVMNKQRESIYALRRELLEGKIHITDDEAVDTRDYLMTLAEELLDSTVDTYTGPEVDPEERDLDALILAVGEIYGVDPAELEALDLEGMRPEEMTDALWAPILEKYETKEKLIPIEILHRVERDIMLQIVDAQWKDHLYSLDHLKEGHRPARLRPARSARRVQEGELRAVHRDEGPGRGRDRPVSVAADAGRRRRARRHGCPSAAPPPRRPPQPMTLNAPSASAPSPFGAVGGRRRQPDAAASRAHRRRRRRPPGQARRAERSAATIPARAAAGRNTRSAMGRNAGQSAMATELRALVSQDARRAAMRAAERSLPFFF